MFKYYIAGTLCLATAIAASSALAESMTSLSDVLDVPIKFGQVVEVASSHAEGDLLEVSREEFAGQQIYLVTLATETKLTDLAISANDGSVLATSVQTTATPEIMEELIAMEIEEELEFFDAVGDADGFALYETAVKFNSCEKN